MSDIRGSFDRWSCLFCGNVAILKTRGSVVCESRTCSCGAVAFASLVVDSDEILDDALAFFQVRPRDGDSRVFGDIMLEAGVEIREDTPARIQASEGLFDEYATVWFRRSSTSTPA